MGTIPWLSCLLLVVVVMTSLPGIMTSSSTEYVGQVRVYVDLEGINKWTRTTGKTADGFRHEMNSTFYEVNQIYKSLENYNIHIQLQIQDLRLLDRNILNVYGNGKVIHSKSLEQFENWLSPSYSNDNYDLAILFTGYDLTKGGFSDSSYGYAYKGTVCSAKALAVIELSGTLRDVLATAHEIGHILGGDHDGEDSASSCNSHSGEIMNPSTDYASPNRFYFSRCSANSIGSVLGDDGSCMRSWYYSYDITGPRYASLMTSPDEICKRRFGTTSYIARKAYESYGDSVCLQLACMTKTEGHHFYWNYVPTPEGLDCGKNKQCFKGKCIQTSGGSAGVSDSCPFGDQPKIEGSYQTTCAKLTSARCPSWKKTCCQMCSNIGDPGTADEVCQILEGKDSMMARRAYGSYGNDLCTKLSCLSRVEGTSFYWKSYTAPDGMKCGKNKRCSGGQCVVSNTGDPSMSDRCPYGDQPWLAGSWQTTCHDYVTQKGCGGSGWEKTCCSSCYDPGTADEVCQNLEGKDSMMARRAYGSYGNDLCTKLSCLSRVDGTSFYWNNYKTPDGMKCGKNKRCSGGVCVETKAGDPDMSDSCPYGDQPWLAGSWQTTCDDYVTQNGCGGSGWNQTCCHLCNIVDPGTADEVCRQKFGKDSTMARRSDSSHGNNLCSQLPCLTNVMGTRFSWNYYKAPDGMKCGKNKRCDDGQCVVSIHGDPNMSDRCPYGDQPWLAGSWQTTCQDYVRQNGCGGTGWDKICCSSCGNKGLN